MKQIDALIQAFDLRINPNFLSIGEEMENILNGSFYEYLGMEVSKELNAYMHEYLRKTNLDKSSIHDIELWDFKLGCRKLVKYKILLYQLLKFNSGVLECSPRYSFNYFQIQLVREINDNIIGKYDKLDEILELIINPKHRVFPEQELVQHYGYVSESDLTDADLENWLFL